MDEKEAAEIALESRQQFGVSTDYRIGTVEKRIIELVADGQPVGDVAPKPGRVRDVIAWVVRLGHENAWVEFAVEDASKQVVRFRRSRGAALSMKGEQA